MENINVEQIMEDIRKDIKEKGMTLDVPSFDDIPLKEGSVGSDAALQDLDSELDQTIFRLEGECDVQYYYPMQKGVKSMIKKVIRKTVHCVFFPIMESQNRFNKDVVHYLDADRKRQAKRYKDILKRVKTLEAENQKLKEKLYSKNN